MQIDVSTDAYMARMAVIEGAWAVQEAMTAPHVLMRPELSVDGNMYCALYGPDLHSGCAGFGETPEAAMADFDKNWREMKAPQPKRAE